MDIQAYLISFPVDFKIARSHIRFSQHIVLSLSVDGLTGLGAGVLYRSTLQACAQRYKEWLRVRLAGVGSLHDLLDLRARIISDLAGVAPHLAFAFDTAVWDLQAQQTNGQSLGQALGGARRSEVPITEQVFITSPVSAERELAAILARGTRSVKIKIGQTPDRDVGLMRRVRAVVGGGVNVRLDLNQRYHLEEGKPVWAACHELDMATVEEPLRGGDRTALCELRRHFGLTVMLDESVRSPADLRNAIDTEAIDVLNLKLTRVGGISLALQARALCESAGIGIALGCAEDLGVGMAAILHLASSVQDLHSTEGVGHLRLGCDVIREDMPLVNGVLRVPSGPGLGVHLDMARLRACGQARFFDLNADGSHVPMRLYSLYARNAQRCANLLYRTVGGGS